MDPLKDELKEFIQFLTWLSTENAKCPPPSEDLDYFANYLANLLHTRMQKCMEADDRPQAVNFISEIQLWVGGIEQSLRGRFAEVTRSEMDFFNREWEKRHPFRARVEPGAESKAQRQRAARKAYEKMMRSMGR